LYSRIANHTRRATAASGYRPQAQRRFRVFGTRAFGSQSNGKRLMSELRAAMRATFGIGGDPFEKYSFRERSWKVKFRALAAPPADLEEAMREVGLSPRRENPRT
jgi:hypothetical protein